MLYIASDHAGYQLKKFLAEKLKTTLKIEVEDLGPHKYEEDDDFPDFARPLTKKVLKNKSDRGILICGSGHGMCIAANKFKGARAILAGSTESADMGRTEEDANILCLSARLTSEDHALAIVKHFLEKEFDDQEKRIRRLNKINEIK
jgi:ribose 5-phosphate isomerase B